VCKTEHECVEVGQWEGGGMVARTTLPDISTCKIGDAHGTEAEGGEHG
jgi:hypothetical protein